MRDYITCNAAIEAGNYEALKAIRAYVAGTGRGRRRERIFYGGVTPGTCGILSRLWYYPETGKVFYCAGQDWNAEMGVIRDLFDGRRK